MKPRPPLMEFHISRAARERYAVDSALFTLSGNVVLANLAASRALAHAINQRRDVEHHPERAVEPGALNAMGLIDEVLHFVAARFRRERDPRALDLARAFLEHRLGRGTLERLLLAFSEEFPALAAHRGELSAVEWLAGSTGGVPHRSVALEELLMLALANGNPAFGPFRELFDDTGLARKTAYAEMAPLLREFFEDRERFGPFNQNLVDMLRAPAIAFPDSLERQLHYIRTHWAELLGELELRLLTGLDLLREEEKALFMRFHPAVDFVRGDSSRTAVIGFAGAEHDPERFSTDRDWMPRAVLMAKSAFVWLDQLSRRYGRAIQRLDQIPDEELDRLAGWGFTGLWLIGLWERSRASQRIKQLTGNPEAVASAYSLLDYRIAEDLGGETAFLNLRERAAVRGIRLASDMVPNHMGIDSRWVIEHPDYFLGLDHPPYPSYSFNGPDISSDERVAIQIEDHYYDRSDAAVVFKRTDRWTGNARYLYHGNDGTSFPWNDTAQLDYLKPEVREAVIQTILHVARQFPIIRFDAAMTLAKKHYQRLWFPDLGSGGAIPSRAEHRLARAAFDAAMPQEFWREVVDRVAAEAPDTLLLAEAFWLMEGYFVRTLGMHRVYNSAFMNMLRDEQNANYRSVIKNTLEFDPEVLKRFVNFMNNPDERTAVDQFGKGDKYFGVCTLMATLPGLPMFGHGQIEGFTERYGMEYRRAYYDEQPDPDLVSRHERELFPLLRYRWLFAEARDFLLYDFFTPEGHVNEDVFAYSNRSAAERALVLYHNRFAETRGWIRTSVAYAVKTASGKELVRRTLTQGLGLPAEDGLYLRCRDAATGLEHLFAARELAERGLYVELRAYERRVFVDWTAVDDATRRFSRLYGEIGGRGVSSLEEALVDMELRPVHEAFRATVSPEHARRLAGATTALDAPENGGPTLDSLLEEVERSWELLISEVARFGGVAPAPAPDGAPPDLRRRLLAACRLPALAKRFEFPWPDELRGKRASVETDAGRNAAAWGGLLGWVVIESLGRVWDARSAPGSTLARLEELRLRPLLAATLNQLGLAGEDAWRTVARIRASFAHTEWHEQGRAAPSPRQRWLADPEVQWLIGVHEHEGARYFNREAFAETLWWMSLPELLDLAVEPDAQAGPLAALEDRLGEWMRDAASANWRFDELAARRSRFTETPGARRRR